MRGAFAMLPQFNAVFFPSQVFWLTVCFGALYFLMARVALPRIADVLSERQRRLDDDLDRATQIKAEIVVVIRAYEQALVDAHTQARVVLQQEQDGTSRLLQEHHRALTKRIAIEIKNGERHVAIAKQVALEEVKEASAEVAEAIVICLVGLTLESSLYKRTVIDVMKEHSVDA